MSEKETIDLICKLLKDLFENEKETLKKAKILQALVNVKKITND